MNKKAQSEIILREIVTLFGFLEGIWMGAGIFTQSKAFSIFSAIVPSMDNQTKIFMLLIVSPLLIFFITIGAVFSASGWQSAAAILLAFIGGILSVQFKAAGVIILFGALIVAAIASSDELKALIS